MRFFIKATGEEMAAISIVDNIISTNFGDLPDNVVNESKLCLLDWLGVCLAGSRSPIIDILMKIYNSNGKNHIVGHSGKRTSVLDSALLNGTASHVMDYDDVNMSFKGHLSTVIFPAIFALADGEKISGKELLTSFITGYEAAVRISLAATEAHYKRGWHSTSTIGNFASVIAAGKLLGLTKIEFENALGIAGTLSSGLQASFGTMCKPFHAGNASRNGLIASMLAKEGFTGSRDIFESDIGFFNVFSGPPLIEELTKAWGRKWHILDNQYKIFPSCFQTHASVIAVLRILKKNSELAGRIEKIIIEVNPVTAKLVSNLNPLTSNECRFSVEYCVSNIVINNSLTMTQFNDDLIHNNKVRKFMQKITVNPNEMYDLDEAAVTIYVADKNKVYKESLKMSSIKTDYKKNQLNIKNKYLELTDKIISKGTNREIITLIDKFELLSDVNELIKLLI